MKNFFDYFIEHANHKEIDRLYELLEEVFNRNGEDLNEWLK